MQTDEAYAAYQPYRTPLHPLARVPAAAPAPLPYPEMPCSITAHVDMDGLRVQITGRGPTPADAAAQFRGTLAAMQPAPVTSPSRTAQIAALLTCWLDKAVTRQDWPLVETLSKGAALALAGAVEPGDRVGVVAVRSATHPDTWYEVEGLTCTCPAYQQHVRKGVPEYACKHRCAAAFVARLT